MSRVSRLFSLSLSHFSVCLSRPLILCPSLCLSHCPGPGQRHCCVAGVPFGSPKNCSADNVYAQNLLWFYAHPSLPPAHAQPPHVNPSATFPPAVIVHRGGSNTCDISVFRVAVTKKMMMDEFGGSGEIDPRTRIGPPTGRWWGRCVGCVPAAIGKREQPLRPSVAPRGFVAHGNPRTTIEKRNLSLPAVCGRRNRREALAAAQRLEMNTWRSY